MKMQLRPYQREAVSAALRVIKAGGHPVLSLPTGSGKSLVVAEVARLALEAGQRVLIVTHVQELVEGNAREFEKLTGIQPGVLCAGLERVRAREQRGQQLSLCCGELAVVQRARAQL